MPKFPNQALRVRFPIRLMETGRPSLILWVLFPPQLLEEVMGDMFSGLP